CIHVLFSFLLIRRQRRSPLLPSTTLFRSVRKARKGDWAGNGPQAIAAFKRAVAEDPDFALAWARLSIARSHVYVMGVDSSEANLDRKSTRLNSSHVKISYAVFCLKKKMN